MSVSPPRRRKTFLQLERVETDWAGVHLFLSASYEARRVANLISDFYTVRMTLFVASPPKLHSLIRGGGRGVTIQ